MRDLYPTPFPLPVATLRSKNGTQGGERDEAPRLRRALGCHLAPFRGIFARDLVNMRLSSPATQEEEWLVWK